MELIWIEILQHIKYFFFLTFPKTSGDSGESRKFLRRVKLELFSCFQGGPLLCPVPGEQDRWFVGGIVSIQHYCLLTIIIHTYLRSIVILALNFIEYRLAGEFCVHKKNYREYMPMLSNIFHGLWVK